MRTRLVIDPELWPSVASQLAEAWATLDELLIAPERRNAPDLVHDVRGALRRAQVAEALSTSPTDRATDRRLASPLTRLGAQLARVRDLDVAATIMKAHPELIAERSTRAERLPELAHAARDYLVRQQPTSRRVDEPAIDLERLVDTWERRAKGAAHRPGMDELHALRRSARQLRLASELLAPMSPATSARLRRRALALTAHLGRAHDLQIAATLLERSARSTARVLARRATKLARGWQPLAARTSAELEGWLYALTSRNAPSRAVTWAHTGAIDDDVPGDLKP